MGVVGINAIIHCAPYLGLIRVCGLLLPFLGLNSEKQKNLEVTVCYGLMEEVWREDFGEGLKLQGTLKSKLK